MGFWRSLRQWWNWDGTPETDPFRDRFAEEDGALAVDVSGHALAPAEGEPAGQSAEDEA